MRCARCWGFCTCTASYAVPGDDTLAPALRASIEREKGHGIEIKLDPDAELVVTDSGPLVVLRIEGMAGGSVPLVPLDENTARRLRALLRERTR